MEDARGGDKPSELMPDFETYNSEEEEDAAEAREARRRTRATTSAEQMQQQPQQQRSQRDAQQPSHEQQQQARRQPTAGREHIVQHSAEEVEEAVAHVPLSRIDQDYFRGVIPVGNLHKFASRFVLQATRSTLHRQNGLLDDCLQVCMVSYSVAWV
jgi:cobalamin-dependent methionine synthase I